MDRCHFRLAESFPENLVFFLIHGAVQVSRFAFIVAGHAVHHVHIQGVFRHNGSSGIVEMKSFAAAEIFNIFCQSPFGQRPCGNNDDALGDGSYFLSTKVTRGWSFTRRVTSLAYPMRSTAKAPPAGTWWLSAAFIMTE